MGDVCSTLVSLEVEDFVCECLRKHPFSEALLASGKQVLWNLSPYSRKLLPMLSVSAALIDNFAPPAFV
jgi:hypothetical protein